jgi:outer membrane protein assembly factor BamB
MALDSEQAFTLTAESLIVHPGRGHLATRSASDGLAAYDPADGSLLWSSTLPNEPFLGAWLADDALLIPVDEDAERGDVRNDGTSTLSTVAVDVATGARRWRVAGNVSTTVNGLGVVEEPDDRTGQPTALRAIRLTDGQTVWKRSFAGGQNWAYGTDRLIAVAADGSTEVVRLADGSTMARGRLTWQTEAQDAISSTALQISGNAVFVSQDRGSHQVVTAYELDTLRQRWRIEQPKGRSMNVCETVLCLSDATATVAYDVTTGAPRWRADGWTEPSLISPGRLLVSNGQATTAFATVDAETGHILAELGPGTPTGWTLDRLYYLRYTRTPIGQVSVSRLNPRTGRTQMLGTVGLVFPDQCQASATRLVCPQPNGTLTVTDVS